MITQNPIVINGQYQFNKINDKSDAYLCQFHFGIIISECEMRIENIQTVEQFEKLAQNRIEDFKEQLRRAFNL